MSTLDWIVLCSTLGFITIYGIIKSRGKSNLTDYILGDQKAVWWKVGFTVMATQASAITFISTTGQGYSDGLKFIQFYFGLPLAMLVICITFIPIFYKLKVYTAYEFLEKRFDIKTRTLTASLFLIQRGIAAGLTLYAPSIILSTVFNWNLQLTHVISGLLVILYTVGGGAKAVTATQLQQLAVIFIGMFFIFFFLIYSFPQEVSFPEIWTLAGWSNKMDAIDLSLNFNDRYNIWAGITGGFFLALSYFGTDQSQVQRYLSGKNIHESRLGLIMNGILKIPMQFFILSCGVLLFSYFQFQKTPIHFNQRVEKEIAIQHPAKYQIWNDQLNLLHEDRIEQLSKNTWDPGFLKQNNSNVQEIHQEVREFVKTNLPKHESNDKDYIFLYFILNYLPHGTIGLLIAVILCAAMSSISAELNALSGTTTVDIYKRFFAKNESNDDISRSRWFTVMWGLVAISFAMYASLFENLIQFINIVGSLFYGTVLGIFLVAFYIKRVQGNAVFIAALIAQGFTFYLYNFSGIGFLWYNVIACFNVVVLSLILQWYENNKKPSLS
ncbi:MAG: sodium:solute symporter [Bacteroidota bacterium]|nr:sodium:solute symporter [Bacteroidota bacterium]